MPQSCGYVTKTQYAELFYTHNWATKDSYLNDGSDADTGWLQGKTIAASSWELVGGPDSALVIDDATNTSVLATVKLTGGTLGTDAEPNIYEVMNKITLSSGEKESHILSVRIIK